MQPILWTVHDRYGNQIYLTQERWAHILDPFNHPEMANHVEELRLTIEQGTRRQEALNPQKYRYTRAFRDLAGGNTHVVAIVLFKFRDSVLGMPISNNYVVTAYLKEIE